MFRRDRFPIVILWTIIATLVLSNNAMAYIGPGSGMEFIGYAMGLLAMIGVAFLSVIMWPVYTILRWIRGTKAPAVAEPPTSTAIAPVADSSVPSPSSPPSDNRQTTPPSPSVP